MFTRDIQKKKTLFHAPGAFAYSGKRTAGAWTGAEAEPCARLRGSLTLEATMALTLFLFFILAVISFLMMMHVQIRVQSSMEDAARKMGKTAYLLDQADGTLSAGSGSSSEGIDQSTQTILQAGINPATMQLMLLTDSSLSQLLESSRVSGGISGLHTYASSYDPGSGLLDLVVNYDYKVPWLPGSFGNLRLVQRARCHAWVGDSLQKGGDSDGTDSHKVYVTPTGTVYHTSPDCNYLDLSIQAVTGYAVSGMRNAAGARYYPCEECARGGLSGTVYITDYGTRYHTSLGCSGLKRTVQEVELDDVGDMRMCTKCASHEAHEH